MKKEDPSQFIDKIIYNNNNFLKLFIVEKNFVLSSIKEFYTFIEATFLRRF